MCALENLNYELKRKQFMQAFYLKNTSVHIYLRLHTPNFIQTSTTYVKIEILFFLNLS